MTTRIWLTSEANEAFQVKQEKYYGDELKDVAYLNDIEVKTDKESKKKYLDLYFDPIDPASSHPVIAASHVERISFMDEYYEGLRTDGLYRLASATARVKTHRSVRGGGFSDDNVIEQVSQHISISAANIDDVREVYSKIRSGELKPAANWGASQYELERKEREAAQSIIVGE